MDRQDQTNQPDIAPVEAVKNPFDTFGVAIFLVVLVEVILLFGLNLYYKSRTQSLSQKLIEHQATLASAEFSTLNTQLEEVLEGQDLLKTALASRVQWSKFYLMFNAVTPKNVRINTMQVSDTGTFRADGETASLSSLAQAIVAWQKGSASAPTPFSKIILSSNSFSNIEGRRVVAFSISGTADLGRIK